MVRARRILFLKLAVLCALTLSHVQTACAQSDVQALSILQRAAAAQMGATSIQDVQLTGSAVLHIGTDQRGSVTLQVDSSGRSKIVLDLDGGRRTEYSSGHGEAPECTWTDTDGKSHSVAVHNCFTQIAWFMPALSLASGVQLGHHRITYGGSKQLDKNTFEHLTLNRVITGQDPEMTAQLQRLSNLDLAFDSATMLPSSLTYFTHPESDLTRNIPVEIRFSDYRDVNGVKIPFHIEKLLSGNTLLEITVESATFNTGVPTK